ncbi:MAG: DNA-directed RNA polymerase subunit alpha [Acidobacteriota bacterium]|nr:DNA-directed RNA polymerase subunit alpha [Acidobacteriota bacterium]MDE3262565.1 DNA-directed RNA polymerase subunit alpha [Acidobacteriota bacterium]
MSELRRPSGLNIETSSDDFGRFSAHPFERGYGVTIGNALRRLLISSIQGAAVTAVKFDGVQHEMSTIPGVKEDTLDIILNIKRIPLRLHGTAPRTIRLQGRKAGPLTSGDIETDPNVEILDPDVHLATITQPAELDIEMRVKNGRGYIQAERNRDTDLEVGYIPLDSTHSPVRKVNYKVEPARVGQDTDLDKLVIDVHTNGSIRPQEAVTTAARLLREMLGIFVGGEGEATEDVVISDEQKAYELHCNTSIDDYADQLSVRAYNGLRNADIATIGDLVVKSESELLRERNIGRKSIEEVERILDGLGLKLGMGQS